MSTIVVTPLSAGALSASTLNTMIDTIVSDYNGNVTEANVLAAANIQGSKMRDGSLTTRKFKPTAGLVRASGNVALTVNFQDITGATVDIVCATASTVIVHAVFDFQGVVTTSNTVYGQLVVASVAQSGYATCDSNNANALRATVGQVWMINVAAGTHTFKLQAKTTSAVGAEQCNQTNTCLMYEVISQ